MDALVRAFASDDDGMVVATDDGGIVNEHGADDGDGVDGGDPSDASDASGGAPEDALGDLSD